jgi:hypothetical protein
MLKREIHVCLSASAAAVLGGQSCGLPALMTVVSLAQRFRTPVKLMLGCASRVGTIFCVLCALAHTTFSVRDFRMSQRNQLRRRVPRAAAFILVRRKQRLAAV